jgi:hypothetical protein
METHPMVTKTPLRMAALAALAGLLALPAARAEQARPPAAPTPARVQAECGACHVAYPATLLPASSWQRLMATLPRHFGTDASLDAAAAAEIGAWLAAHAAPPDARRGREAPPDNRITRTAWFVREHREVPAATWARPAIKSASNCAACHGGAEQGNFNEDDVRIPR